MADDRSRRALLEFLDYLGNKGLAAKNTVAARKAAASKVLGVLGDDEAHDIIAIDLSDVMARFQNLNGNDYTPTSLTTYRSRVKAAIEDFESYLKNPLGFRPSIQSRERASKSANNAAKPSTLGHAPLSSEPPRTQKPTFPNSMDIIPIPLRADLTIYIQGLPFDLSENEARKISNVVQAMAMPKN